MVSLAVILSKLGYGVPNGHHFCHWVEQNCAFPSILGSSICRLSKHCKSNVGKQGLSLNEFEASLFTPKNHAVSSTTIACS